MIYKTLNSYPKFIKRCICGSRVRATVGISLQIRCNNCYNSLTLLECNIAPINYLTISGKARCIVLINGWNKNVKKVI